MIQRSESTCPHCGNPVDPLRAPAVSIVGARIVHFCSVVCREAHVRSSLPALSEGSPGAHTGPPASTANESAAVGRTTDEVVTAESAPTAEPEPVQAASPLLGRAIWRDVSLVSASIALVAAFVAAKWPSTGVLVGLAAGGLLALWQIVCGVLRGFRLGFVRVLDEVAAPVSAAALLASATSDDLRPPGVVCALGVFAATDLGRVMLSAARRRSGLLEVLDSPAASLGESFRDNSRQFVWNQRIGIALTVSRFPIALLVGFLTHAFGGTTISATLALSACVLLALGARPLMLATLDAYYGAALRLARTSCLSRDSEAMEQLGATRIFLFEGAGTAFGTEARVVSLWTPSLLSDETVLEVIFDLEVMGESRIARSLATYAREKGVLSAGEFEVRFYDDQGVEGRTRHGAAACGGRAFLLSQGIGTGDCEERAAILEESGRRAIFVALEGRVVAVIGVEDSPESQCTAAVAKLAAQGRYCLVLSTAEAPSATALARRCGFADACFETPHSNLRQVIAAFDAAGDPPAVVGGTDALEDIASEAVTIRVSGCGLTQAAFDVRSAGLSAVPRVFEISAAAKSSATTNTVAAIGTLLAGVGFATTWPSGETTAFIALLQGTTTAFAALNRPFPVWNRRFHALRDSAVRAYKRVTSRSR